MSHAEITPSNKAFSHVFLLDQKQINHNNKQSLLGKVCAYLVLDAHSACESASQDETPISEALIVVYQNLKELLRKSTVLALSHPPHSTKQLAPDMQRGVHALNTCDVYNPLEAPKPPNN
eukprot:3960535-Amphidinium_carterae.1